jgi:hypothetical protein
MRTVCFCEELGVVGRALQEHREIVRALGDDDDGVQFHTIAHRDHHVALDVVIVRFGLLPFGGDVAAGLNHIAVL